MDECKCSLNYEVEYERLCDKYNQLMKEHAELETAHRNVKSSCAIMSAQIEIVELIFGGRRG